MHSAEVEILKYVQRQSIREKLSCLGLDVKSDSFKKLVQKDNASSIVK